MAARTSPARRGSPTRRRSRSPAGRAAKAEDAVVACCNKFPDARTLDEIKAAIRVLKEVVLPPARARTLVSCATNLRLIAAAASRKRPESWSARS